MNSRCIPALVPLVFAGLAVAATGAPSPGSHAPELEEVLVTGAQPGPALWRVSSGDNDLWILGAVQPLARKVQWRSKQFESLLANSQEVILNNSGHYTQGSQGAQLALATRLPDGQSLQDIVPPELLARVKIVARIYSVSEPLDELSPPVVATRIANASLKSLDLRVVSLQLAVEALARKANVRITHYSTPNIAFEEQLQNARDSAKSACPLELVLQVLEDGGSGLRSLANAWAVGDIEALRRLEPEYGLFTDGNRSNACQKQSDEYLAKRTAAWLVEAERALRENDSTLAVVPMPELFALDGYLAALRERGYKVVEPD